MFDATDPDLLRELDLDRLDRALARRSHVRTSDERRLLDLAIYSFYQDCRRDGALAEAAELIRFHREVTTAA